MPASEILRIAVTVGTVQLILDLLSYWWVYSKEPYQRSVERLERLRVRWEQVQTKSNREQQQGSAASATTTSSGKKGPGTTTTTTSRRQDQSAKRAQRAEDEYKNELAMVARRHTVPNVAASLVFLVLMKVLGTELKGHVIAVLPFEPIRLLHRITGRGLEFGEAAAAADEDDEVAGGMGAAVAQACSFTFVYLLSSMSVKYYVHQLFGYAPPRGADSITAMVDSPAGQNSTFLLPSLLLLLLCLSNQTATGPGFGGKLFDFPCKIICVSHTTPFSFFFFLCFCCSVRQ